MKLGKATLLWTVIWLMVITGLHGAMNLGWLRHAGLASIDDANGSDRFGVGFLPVTCHLTCPVTDFINKNIEGRSFFKPMRFNGWPELKETFIGRPQDMPASFILAPMAIALREQGVRIKVVYLGHRDGSAVVVHKDSDIFQTTDLRGKTIAVPGRFANQRLILHRELKKVGMSLDDIHMVEMPPPDMPAALLSRSVDAVTSGEPYMAQTELDGYGRTLWQAKDVWPGFISCVLAVHEQTIRDHRAEIQRLVNGIAASGRWIDQSLDHRMAAARFVAADYYHQDPRLLRYVLSKPPDRVTFTRLGLLRTEFEEIESLAAEVGMIEGTAHFEDYADESFMAQASELSPLAFETSQ